MNSAEVNSVIDNLCSKFGTTTAYLIPEMARYNIVQDVFIMIYAIIFIVIAFLILKRGYVKYNNEVDRYKNDREYASRHCSPDSTDYLGYWLVGGIIGAIFVVVFMIVSSDLMGWIASPTAAFVQSVLRSIGGK